MRVARRRIGRTAIAVLVACTALSFTAAANAHYPFEVGIPGFWAETLGPSATANPDCQISEVTADIDFSTHWILRTKPYEGYLFTDIPCGQIWGTDGQQARCTADLRSIHHHDIGGEEIVASVQCAVLVPVEVDGRIEFHSRCGGHFTIRIPVSDRWWTRVGSRGTAAPSFFRAGRAVPSASPCRGRTRARRPAALGDASTRPLA